MAEIQGSETKLPEAQPNEGELAENTLENVAGGLPKRRATPADIVARTNAVSDKRENC
jgi:hypothetical protein